MSAAGPVELTRHGQLAHRGRPTRVREVLRLAWPAVLSYLLNNAYRINDQFWVQHLGGAAQAAMGATLYVAIMNFALFFVPAAGVLALVSHATGARDPARRDSLTRHGLLLALGIGLVLAAVGPPLAGPLAGVLGLEGAAAEMATDYLVWIFRAAPALALALLLDSVFIARGNTLVPMTLQALAIGLNYFLNPIFIYGATGAAASPVFGAQFSAGLGVWLEPLGLPPEGLGVGGAALATGISRTAVLGVALLVLRGGFGVQLLRAGRPQLERFRALVRVGTPAATSVAVYAGVYWALLYFVIAPLGPAVVAGLGLGFQVFEGVAFPTYLGVAIATSSLVGRSLGAADVPGALDAVKSARLVAHVLGLAMTAAFLFGAGPLTRHFTTDPAVAAETVRYVVILAFSQLFVAVETVNEKVLLGAGETRPILFISTAGNLARVPLAWLLALGLGLGPAGVWWAINTTTGAKAFFLWRNVQSGRWTRRAAELASAHSNSPAPEAPRSDPGAKRVQPTP